MIQKTTYKKAKSGFDMSEMTSRIKKRFRKKEKKTIKRSKIREVWKDYVDIMIIEPLIEKGKVMIDKHLSIEIVGVRVVEDKRKMALLTRGLTVKRGQGVVPITEVNYLRRGFAYSIVMKDERFKEGFITFDANQNIRKQVYKALCETNKYYRIISKNVN